MYRVWLNPLGSNTVAGFSAALKVSTFAIMVMNALPNALSSFAAQNIGAQDIKRVRQGVRDCIIMSELVIGSIIVLFFVAGQPILQLFLGSSSNGTVISVWPLSIFLLSLRSTRSSASRIAATALCAAAAPWVRL